MSTVSHGAGMSEQAPRPQVTDEEKRAFKRNGFHTVPNNVDDELIAAARQAILEDPGTPTTDAELEEMRAKDPGALTVDYEGRNVKLYRHSMNVDRPEAAADVFAEINERIHEHAAAFVGEGLLSEPGSHCRIVLRFPQDERVTDPYARRPSELGSHIDGPEQDPPHTTTIAVTTHLNDIQPRGGGFTVWPGSHRIVADFVKDHPLGEAGGGIRAPTGAGTWSRHRALDDAFEPVETYGPAGTTTFWHGNIEHCGGINLSPGRVRIGMFSRFTIDGWDEIMDDAVTAPFEHWSAMDGIDIDPDDGREWAP